MAITEADEFPHPTPADRPGWQENCFLMGWDDEQRAGFYLHVERLPSVGHQELKVIVLLDGRVAWGLATMPLDDGFAGVQVVRPFEALRLDARLAGRERDGEHFVALHGGSDVKLGFEVELDAVSPAVDWNALLEGMGVPGTERDHYEQGLRWRGEVTIGDATVAASGLAVRDHTWGVRSYDGFSRAWWTPMCFDDGTYLTGVSLDVGGQSVGGSIIARPGEEPALLQGHAVTASPGDDAGEYQQVVVDAGGCVVDAEARVHLPVPYPGFGLPFLSSEAFCELSWDGQGGFGTVEINRALRPDECAGLGLVP